MGKQSGDSLLAGISRMKTDDVLTVEVKDGKIVLSELSTQGIAGACRSIWRRASSVGRDSVGHSPRKRGMVMNGVEQGALLKVEGLAHPVIVVSNNFFNQSGKVIVCPILKKSSQRPAAY